MKRIQILILMGLSLGAIGFVLFKVKGPGTTSTPPPENLRFHALGAPGAQNTYWLTIKMDIKAEIKSGKTEELLELKGEWKETTIDQGTGYSERKFSLIPYAIAWLSDGKTHEDIAAIGPFLQGDHRISWTTGTEQIQFKTNTPGRPQWQNLIRDIAGYTWLSLPDNQETSWTKRESDAMGSYEAEYSDSRKGSQRLVTRSVLKYIPRSESFQIQVDPITKSEWLLSDAGNILQHSTRLKTKVKGEDFQSDVDVSISLSQKRPLSDEALAPLASASAAPKVASESPSSGGKTTDELFSLIRTIDPETKNTDYYGFFTDLKSRWAEHPEEIEKVLPLLRSLSSKNPAEKRQMGLLYGALAQTNRPESAEILNTLMSEVQDEEAQIQAAAALGDHQSPNEQSLKVLWKHVEQPGTDYSRNTALLAYGSVAHHLTDPPQEVIDTLLKFAEKQPDGSTMRDVVVAAMGNHGSREYWPYLKQMSSSPSALARAQALYSMRNLKDPEVPMWIAQTATQDKSEDVKGEAVKALSYQLGQRDTLDQLTTVALSSTNREVQMRAARILKEGTHARPESATRNLQKLLEQSKFEDVKAYIRSTSTP